MKRWIVYGAALAAAVCLTGNRSAGIDVGKLEPIEVVRINVTGLNVRIETDTGRKGAGRSLEMAVMDMKRSADRELFLDTADYLLIDKEGVDLMAELAEMLRPSCKVCLENGEAELEGVGAFLTIHDPKMTLLEYRKTRQVLPKLLTVEGRMYLVQP